MGKRHDKIRKLLAVAECETATEAEREAAQRKAIRLMELWDIDRPAAAKAADPISEHTYLVTLGNANKGAVCLVGQIVKTVGGACYQRRVEGLSGQWKTGSMIHVYATGEQMNRIRIWSDHLLHQMNLDVLRDRPASRMSYSYGWASRVSKRLAEIYSEERTAAAQRETALAVRTADDIMRAENRVGEGTPGGG